MLATLPRGTISEPAAASRPGVPALNEDNQAPVEIPGPAPVQSFAGRVSSRGVLGVPSRGEVIVPLLPVADIAQYLEQRNPVPHFDSERQLFITLPETQRRELSALLGERPGSGAFGYLQSLVKARLSVSQSCLKALSLFRLRDNPKTIRAKFDLWTKSQDWLVLVNKSKAGAAWQETTVGLPDAFITQVAVPYFGRYRRADARRQAILGIHRWWRTGKNIKGETLPMPGYEKGWSRRAAALLPDGFSESNIRRQITARNAFDPATQKLLHESIAAAKEFLPQVLGTRAGLRFLEEITFDDVRTDFLVFDPRTGQPCELWLLIARDTATAMVLGFVMHFSLSRPDGSDSHLGQKEMRELAAWILERYPLPPYTSVWRIERGTATLSAGSAAALQELAGLVTPCEPLSPAIRISYTGMVGGSSPAGLREKAKGNSRGKASHESHNRLLHTQAAHLPGQTGNRWDVRPADLNARAKESIATWELRNRLPEHLRGQEKYTLLTPAEAREHLVRIFIEQNFRDDHALEGFAEVLEWFDPADGKLKPRNTCPFPLPPGARIVKRMERPVERALKLIGSYQFRPVSPEIIIAFLSHLQRKVAIKPSGEIELSIDDRKIRFAPPEECARPGRSSVLSGRSVLAYYSPNDPAFLHVTDGRGGILGTWYRRDRVPHADQEALRQAIRYTAGALKAAKEYAARLAQPERLELEAIRLHNAQLDRGNEFIEIAEVGRVTPCAPLSSPVAAALTTVAQKTRAQLQAEQRQRDQQADQARATFRKAASLF